MCGIHAVIMATIYLDRIKLLDNYIVFNYHNIHRYLIISIMVSAKFANDLYYDNKQYARIGGISL